MKPMQGKVAIVTHAAHGIGRAVAEILALQGASVMLTDTDETEGQNTIEELKEDFETVEYFHADITKKLHVNNLMAATLDTFKRVDILVNGIGMVGRMNFLDIPEDHFDAVLNANLKSAFVLSQIVAKRMIQQATETEEVVQNAGAIVNISSISSKITGPQLLPFSVSCAALDQLTRSMAVSLAPHNIRVNGVAHGGVMTHALRKALPKVEGLREAITARTPLQRIGEAQEAANACVFLASDAASFITGQILAVDGGRLALDPISAPNYE
jgi:7-alpha-hydroxysteroid dehydrogenase